ncbi:MAG: sodium:solute symporter family protein [Verrucomicrobiota bacterium]
MEVTNITLSRGTGWILLAIFSVAWVALGIMWGRKAKDHEGFMLAGRNVGMALGAATAMATWVTSNTIMLAPQFALKMGIWGMLAYSTASFGLFLFAPMAFRIRKLLPKGFTSGDFVRLRYGEEVWVLFLVVSLIYSMAWLVSMAMAGGIVLQTLSGIDYKFGMSVILAVCVIYTLFGGLFAVIGTDFVQSLIILIGIVVVGAVVLTKVDLGTVYADVATTQPALLDVMMPVALLALFNNMFFGFGEIFHNNVWWSRAFAMRGDVSHKAFLLSGFLWFPIPIAAGFIALCAGSLGINETDIDGVGPLVASQVLGPAGAVVVFIVVFCSLASSIDSLLAATSDLVVQDIYRKMIRPDASEARLRRLGSLVIIGLGLLTWVIALPRVADLNVVLFLSGPLVASVIFPVIGGLYWKDSGKMGAFLAILLGSGVGLTTYFLIGWYTASLISAGVSLLVMVISTQLAPQDYDWDLLDESRIENKPDRS